MSKQLEMKFQVLEKAVVDLINITSSITTDMRRMKAQIDKIERGAGSSSGVGSDSGKPNQDENFELDISQVQKILKQQTAPNTIGKRVINN
jgi:hypothetical protein